MNKILITFDTDWAPDFVIEKIVENLIKNKIKSTWFITHDSPIFEKMKKNTQLFEIGLHPNFYPHSDHGNTEENILTNIQKLCPEATSIRMHGLYQSSNLLRKISELLPNIKVDVSLYIPNIKYIYPFNHFTDNKRKIKRIPFVWEDDFEFLGSQNWSLDQFSKNQGVTILNFHPIHVYLNSASSFNYDKVKEKYSSIRDVPEYFLDQFINKNEGSGSMFDECVEYFKDNKSYKINEVI